jgi:hypothetical protein
MSDDTKMADYSTLDNCRCPYCKAKRAGEELEKGSKKPE